MKKRLFSYENGDWYGNILHGDIFLLLCKLGEVGNVMFNLAKECLTLRRVQETVNKIIHWGLSVSPMVWCICAG